MRIGVEHAEELRARLLPGLKILKVVISEAWGGLEQTAFADARALAREGFSVTLLVKQDSPIAEHARLTAAGICIEVFSPVTLRKGFDFQLMRKVRQVVLAGSINLVHLHQSSLVSSVVPALRRLSEIGLVLSRHILNDHNKRDPFHALIYRRVDYILVLSRAMQRNLAETLPVPEKKLRVVNLGLDLESFDPSKADRQEMRKYWAIPENAFLIGVVGRLDPMKGQDLVIKALANLKRELAGLHLVIVGAETPGLKGVYRQSLERAISDLRLEDVVSLVGPETRIPKVMAALDLFIMPSQEEAFGLVAIEAMAMRVPTILSRAGSSEEIAQGGRAELFRPGDAYDLSKKIRRLYENSELRSTLAERAFAYVQEQHSYQGRMLQTLDVYLRCGRRRNLLQSSTIYGIKTPTL